jgi:hypothetical protein
MTRVTVGEAAAAVGAWEDKSGYVCFGSWEAVKAFGMKMQTNMALAHLENAGARDAAEADRWLALGRAIERAAGELPEGYELVVEVEKGAGTVALIDTDGDRIEELTGDTLAAQVESAIGYAVERAAELADG